MLEKIAGGADPELSARARVMLAQLELSRGRISRVHEVLTPLIGMGYPARAEVDSALRMDGAPHVLVVDDDNSVGRLTAEMLEIIGCRAMVCTDGEEAVDFYRRMGDEVDVVLLDLVMPNMNGEAVFRALKRIDPQVRVLVSSGYSVDGGAQELLANGASGFIQKPFTIADLKANLDAVLG